eukprot:209827_1
MATVPDNQSELLVHGYLRRIKLKIPQSVEALICIAFSNVILFKIGDRIRLSNVSLWCLPYHDATEKFLTKQFAQIKYIGTTGNREEDIYYGIETEQWIPNSLHYNFDLFDHNPGRGYLAKLFELEDIDDNNKLYPLDETTNDIKIGDHVTTRCQKYGVVSYIGSVHFHELEQVYGLTLDQSCPNGGTGTVHGYSYFKAAQGTGYWQQRSNIKKIQK